MSGLDAGSVSLIHVRLDRAGRSQHGRLGVTEAEIGPLAERLQSHSSRAACFRYAGQASSISP